MYRNSHTTSQSTEVSTSASSLARFILAVLLSFVPPLLFEKYTFYLYLIASPEFFNYSGERIWFDITWFVVAGFLSVLLVGRSRRLAFLPPVIGAAILIIAAFNVPFCEPRECYVSSTDGLGAVRDFLLLGSVGFLSGNAGLSEDAWKFSSRRSRLSEVKISSFVIATLLGYALSFFPILHIFAGVSVVHPLNYLQWFLAAGPSAFLGSFLFVERNQTRILGFLSGLSGITLGIATAVDVPCMSCSGYTTPIASILLLAAAFSILGVFVGTRIFRKHQSAQVGKKPRLPTAIVASVILITILTLWGLFLTANFQASVYGRINGASSSGLSPFEAGHSVVYSGGYLAIPRVVTQSVGVSVSFGNTNISGYTGDFLAAGVGDQSPNCCKDGLDLAYRADAILFANGSESVLARAWWACDENIACSGYTWQQILYSHFHKISQVSFANTIELEMNWTSSINISWFYRIHFDSNGSLSSWNRFGTFTPPKIQNHYFDAGLYYVGEGNQPTDFAYFYQFGVWSGYPIHSSRWQVTMQCPKLVLNGSWACLPSAGFISGEHSFWKVLYTFGESYSGVSYRYLGNYSVSFFYAGKSPPDETRIW